MFFTLYYNFIDAIGTTTLIYLILIFRFYQIERHLTTAISISKEKSDGVECKADNDKRH